MLICGTVQIYYACSKNFHCFKIVICLNMDSVFHLSLNNLVACTLMWKWNINLIILYHVLYFSACLLSLGIVSWLHVVFLFKRCYAIAIMSSEHFHSFQKFSPIFFNTVVLCCEQILQIIAVSDFYVPWESMVMAQPCTWFWNFRLHWFLRKSKSCRFSVAQEVWFSG